MRPDDHEQRAALYRSSTQSYLVTQTVGTTERVWRWLPDPDQTPPVTASR